MTELRPIESDVGVLPAESQPGRFESPYALAALFVVPYLILMLAWAMSNPPGAAPDEPDHLVKAIGVARLHIGEPYSEPVPSSAKPIAKRNASISRVVQVPARLVPDGYKCTAHKPDETAACLPKDHSTGSGTVPVVTPVGSYPPFMYLPIGLAAQAMTSPTRAFLAGRLVCVLMASLLIFFGAAHLVRWLGRRALLGAFLALTPTALFASAMVSTSGVETCGAFALACVGVVAIWRKDSLFAASTQFTLAGSGAALVLSRQLGSVTFTAIVLLIIIRIGWRTVWELIRRRQASFIASILILISSLIAIIWWERRYDHPTDTGRVLDHGALNGFTDRAFGYVRDSVGAFGWVDTGVPRWTVLAWVLLVITLVGMAILLGRGADRWSLVGWLLVLVLVAYVSYATVFYSINANLQARHVIPFFIFCPLLAGVVFVEALERMAPEALRRMFYLAATVMPVIQFTALYINARRYAVGAHGSLAFLGHAKWSPKFGWSPWLGLGLIGAFMLGYAIVRSSSDRGPSIAGMVQSVER